MNSEGPIGISNRIVTISASALRWQSSKRILEILARMDLVTCTTKHCLKSFCRFALTSVPGLTPVEDTRSTTTESRLTTPPCCRPVPKHDHPAIPDGSDSWLQSAEFICGPGIADPCHSITPPLSMHLCALYLMNARLSNTRPSTIPR